MQTDVVTTVDVVARLTPALGEHGAHHPGEHRIGAPPCLAVAPAEHQVHRPVVEFVLVVARQAELPADDRECEEAGEVSDQISAPGGLDAVDQLVGHPRELGIRQPLDRCAAKGRCHGWAPEAVPIRGHRHECLADEGLRDDLIGVVRREALPVTEGLGEGFVAHDVEDWQRTPDRRGRHHGSLFAKRMQGPGEVGAGQGVEVEIRAAVVDLGVAHGSQHRRPARSRHGDTVAGGVGFGSSESRIGGCAGVQLTG